MSSLDKNIVEKSNELNTIRNYKPIQEMTLIEYRFFCLYLSKLNARNPNLRTIVIPIREFEELFEVSLHTTHFNDTIEKIMNRKLRIRNESGKMSIINLYSKFEWLDNNNCKKIEVTCNYDIVPYLFELKDSYTSYKIINIVHLNSVSKIRLYEVCKQYQKIGNVRFEIKELQEMLCCRMTQFRDFNSKILKPAIKDINQYTDIQVSYKKNLACRKVVALTFTISKKDNAPKFLPNNVENVENPVNNSLESLYYRCNESYSIEQLEILYNYIENSGVKLNTGIENYIYSVYCQTKIEGNTVNNLFKYTFAIIKKQINDYIFNIQSVQKEEPVKKEPKKKSEKESSFDLEEWKRVNNSCPRRMSDEECFFVLDDFNDTIGFVFESDFDKIVNGTWRELNDRFKNAHLSPESDFGRSIRSLKR